MKKTEELMSIIREMAPQYCPAEIARALGVRQQTVSNWAARDGIEIVRQITKTRELRRAELARDKIESSLMVRPHCQSPAACQAKGIKTHCRFCVGSHRLKKDGKGSEMRKLGQEVARENFAKIEGARRELFSDERRFADELRRIFSYDPITGDLRWRQPSSPKSGVMAGDIAGHVDQSGYRRVSVLGRRILAHRIIWAIVHGRFPKEQIDHANLNRFDNRLCNLREATQSQNMANRVWGNRSLPRGVTAHRKCPHRFIASIRKDRKTFRLGNFDTPEEAAAAYATAAKAMFGEFARY